MKSTSITHKLFLTFLSCILFSVLAKASYLSISGKVSQAIDPELSFYLLNDPLTGEKIKYVAQLGEANEFGIGLEIKEAQIIEVKYGEHQFEFFVSPSYKELRFEFNSQNPSSTLIFQNDGALDNNFLTFFRLKYDPSSEQEEYKLGGFNSFFDAEMVRRAKAYAAEDYFRILSEQYQAKQRYLHNQPTIDRQLYQYIDREIQWKYETNKLAFFLFNKERLDPNSLRQYWVRYALLQSVDISDPSSLKYEVFQNLLETFIHYLYLETPVQSEDLSREYYRFIQRNLSDRCRYFMLAKLMIDNYIGAGNSAIVQRMFKNYKTFNPYTEYTNTLVSTFGNSMEYVAKDIVPNFQVKEESERTLRLSDYQGKVVHISFWASWCAPCLKGFRDSYLARQQLQQLGVVLLNVNMDRTEEEWLYALHRENIQGTNVYPVDITELKSKFKISSLPFYLTVDKHGQRTFISTSDLNVAQQDLLELMRE